MKLLDPKNDFVFKRLFADAPELLAELINAIRYDRPPIQELTVLNPLIRPDEIRGKYIVLDILAADISGERYNVEIQVKCFNDWGARSAFYLARMLSQQVGQGEDYRQAAPAIGVHLLDFDLFNEHPEQCAWRFEMRDQQHHELILGDELQLDIIELRKADRLGVATKPLQNWIAFIEHWQELAENADINYEPVRKAMGRLKELSEEEEAQRMAWQRERALMEEVSYRNQAIREGREEGLKEGRELGLEQGLEQGREEGTQEGSLNRARRDLRRFVEKRTGSVSDVVQARIDSASEDVIDRWMDDLMDGKSPRDL